jgi:hypothetical protein
MDSALHHRNFDRFFRYGHWSYARLTVCVTLTNASHVNSELQSDVTHLQSYRPTQRDEATGRIASIFFGFSVGDFVTAAELIGQIVSALREAGGSASQYQHLTLKLRFLSRALRDVNRLEPAEVLQATAEAIKTTALSCQLPLIQFLESIKKNDKSLGLGHSAGVMKDVFVKVKWQASKKSEAAMKLEAEITAYLGAINLLLGLYKVYAL